MISLKICPKKNGIGLQWTPIYRFSIPKEWDPPKDPRPEWRIKETQVQTKDEDAQRNIRKEKLQPKKHPVPEVSKSRLGSGEKVGTTGPAKAGRSDNQNINVLVKETKHSDDNCDGDASQESELINIESGPTQSQIRDAKIAKTIRNPVEYQQQPRPGAKNQFFF